MPRIDVTKDSIKDIVRLSVVSSISSMNNLSSQFEILIKKKGTGSNMKEVTAGEAGVLEEVTAGEVAAVPALANIKDVTAGEAVGILEEVTAGEVAAVPALAVAESSASSVGAVVPKKETRTKRIPLDLDDMKSTIFSCGLSEKDAVAIVSHVLKLKPWSNQMACTKIKNFTRAVIHLVVYMHYQNVVEDVVCMEYVGRGVGYMNQFQIIKPIQNNTDYNDLVRNIMNKAFATDSVSRCVWHPSSDHMEKWGGNMKSYFFSVLKSSYQVGVFTRDQTPLEGGLFSEWYDVLKSLGISYST